MADTERRAVEELQCGPHFLGPEMLQNSRGQALTFLSSFLRHRRLEQEGGDPGGPQAGAGSCGCDSGSETIAGFRGHYRTNTGTGRPSEMILPMTHHGAWDCTAQGNMRRSGGLMASDR